MNLTSPSMVHGLLKSHGLRPSRRFGQNFLVDANTLNRIVEAGELASGDQALEIGAGLGTLTRALADVVTLDGRVVTIEVDRGLIGVLAETVGDLPQVRVIGADATEISWPDFISHYFGPGPISVVANIPYNITSPLIAALMSAKDRFRVVVLLVQQEVALRLAAAPGTPDYGAFAVFAQYHAAVEVVAPVSRRVFLPAPDVDSAILRLRPHASPPVAVRDEALLFAVVRAAFGQRRKSLLNALSGDPALGWDRTAAATALDSAWIDAGRRGETLSLEEFARLANAAPQSPDPT
ncbi:MAG: 16S rRNA (adenine(1518)-N(6)/adenine(1519)-N(6))-dimethyltransferase RsmA [Capsulimonadaceae bacterium]